MKLSALLGPISPTDQPTDKQTDRQTDWPGAFRDLKKVQLYTQNRRDFLELQIDTFPSDRRIEIFI